jgi:hypothetical protein
MRNIKPKWFGFIGKRLGLRRQSEAATALSHARGSSTFRHSLPI